MENIKHILSASQFAGSDIQEEIYHGALEMRQRDHIDHKIPRVLDNMNFVVYIGEGEYSTRTETSTTLALQSLGGNTINNHGENLSTKKGEKLAQTIKTFDASADGILMRHKEIGAADTASRVVTRAKIVNLGDGAGEHPTQGILDMVTIRDQIGRLDDINIVCTGDFLYGRTVRSLQEILKNRDINWTFLSIPELRMPQVDRQKLIDNGASFKEDDLTDLSEKIKKADVVYATRIQLERIQRIEKENEIPEIKSILPIIRNSNYIFTPKEIHTMKKSAIFMHPLPFDTEIDTRIEYFKSKVVYQKQMENGYHSRLYIFKELYQRK